LKTIYESIKKLKDMLLDKSKGRGGGGFFLPTFLQNNKSFKFKTPFSQTKNIHLAYQYLHIFARPLS